MKFISALFFIALMILSWNLVHKTPALSFETHAGIQERLAVWLEENYRKQFPELTSFRIDKMRTRTVSPDQVEAHITTEYELPNPQPSPSAKAGQDSDSNGTSKHRNNLKLRLERVVDSERTLLERWRVSATTTLEESIDFSDEMLITPGGNENEATDSESDSPSDLESQSRPQSKSQSEGLESETEKAN